MPPIFGSLFRPAGYGYNKPQVSLDEDLSPEAVNSIQDIRIEDLERRLNRLDDHPRNPIEEIVGDDYIYIERIGRKVAIGVDREELQAGLGIGAGGGGGLVTGFDRIGLLSNPTSLGVNDANGNSVKWLYAINEQKPGNAPGELVGDPNGFAGGARNLCELNNTGVGVQGNGVNHDGADYPAGFAMQPAREYVAFKIVTYVNGTTEALFHYVNSEDGLCSGDSE